MTRVTIVTREKKRRAKRGGKKVTRGGKKRNFEPFVSFVESIRSTTKKTGLNSQKASYLDRLFDFLVLGSMV